jgi:hypothetical protein
MLLPRDDRKIQYFFGKTFPSGSFPEAIAGALHREDDHALADKPKERLRVIDELRQA